MMLQKTCASLCAPTRIDNNGKPAQSWREFFWDPATNAPAYIDHVFNGPMWRTLDDGVGSAPGYFGSDPGSPRPPQNFTLPAERGGTKSNGDLKSLLEELDEE